ncbi:hypothetical protein DER29_0521 [Micromonospora sp. M71_S20]|uniref:hypothetical protein n=1 Tax=Micromonospora sp. M71_S20 TaxID=592872 RepID=UPI000EB09F35|nr:hypothetical protein [Micromonospora sp. M71_S20]RLK22682.1 hypothetical protein DER29_0521 [Micromonospora sp. M71_S20]
MNAATAARRQAVADTRARIARVENGGSFMRRANAGDRAGIYARMDAGQLTAMRNYFRNTPDKLAEVEAEIARRAA